MSESAPQNPKRSFQGWNDQIYNPDDQHVDGDAWISTFTLRVGRCQSDWRCNMLDSIHALDRIVKSSFLVSTRISTISIRKTKV